MQVIKKNNYDPLSAIRWRYVLDNNKQPEVDLVTKKVKSESNCRILKWQDGT